MKKLALILALVLALAIPASALAEPIDVAVIIKATTSDFWQYVLVGAENYGKEFPDRVKITTYGPPSEADIDEQVSILENVVSSDPDAIVIASTSSGTPARISFIGLAMDSKRAFTTAVASSPSKGGTPAIA